MRSNQEKEIIRDATELRLSLLSKKAKERHMRMAALLSAVETVRIHYVARNIFMEGEKTREAFAEMLDVAHLLGLDWFDLNLEEERNESKDEQI